MISLWDSLLNDPIIFKSSVQFKSILDYSKFYHEN